MLKKCISLVLSLIMLSGIGSMGASALSWPWGDGAHVDPNYGKDLCSITNKDNKFVDITCAEHACMEGVVTGSKDVELTRVGQDSEYTLYCWDYRGLNRFTSIFGDKLASSAKSFDIESFLTTMSNHVFKMFYLSDKKLADEISKQWVLSSKYTKLTGFSRDIAKEVGSIQSGFQGSLAAGGLVGLIGGAALGFVFPPAALGVAGAILCGGAIGAGTVAGTMGTISSWWQSSTHDNEAKKYEIEVNNYVSAIDQLLTSIKDGDWKLNDLVLIRLNSDPKYHGASTQFRDAGMNYPKEIKDQFEKIFSGLNTDLSELLKKHNNGGK